MAPVAGQALRDCALRYEKKGAADLGGQTCASVAGMASVTRHASVVSRPNCVRRQRRRGPPGGEQCPVGKSCDDIGDPLHPPSAGSGLLGTEPDRHEVLQEEPGVRPRSVGKVVCRSIAFMNLVRVVLHRIDTRSLAAGASVTPLDRGSEGPQMRAKRARLTTRRRGTQGRCQLEQLPTVPNRPKPRYQSLHCEGTRSCPSARRRV